MGNVVKVAHKQSGTKKTTTVKKKRTLRQMKNWQIALYLSASIMGEAAKTSWKHKKKLAVMVPILTLTNFAQFTAATVLDLSKHAFTESNGVVNNLNIQQVQAKEDNKSGSQVKENNKLDAQAYILPSDLNILNESNINKYKGISTLIVHYASLESNANGGIDVKPSNGEVSKDKINLASKHGIKKIMLVNNFDFVGYDNALQLSHTLLDSPELMKSVVKQVAGMAVRDGYDGVEYDFENIAPQTGDIAVEDGKKYIDFLKLSKSEFDKLNLETSVSTHLKANGNINEFIRLREMTAVVDKVTEMAYGANYNSPSALIDRVQLESALEYAKSELSPTERKKLYIGIETNAYQDTGYLDSKGKFVSTDRTVIWTGEFKKYMANPSADGFTKKYDINNQVFYLEKVTKDGKIVKINGEDAKSVADKNAIIKEAGLGGTVDWGKEPIVVKEKEVKAQTLEAQAKTENNTKSKVEKKADNQTKQEVAHEGLSLSKVLSSAMEYAGKGIEYAKSKI